MLSSILRHSALLTLPIAAALTTLAPERADACGGTFCDAGPQVMPVDQTGENILFWIDDSDPEQPYTEAHIQIQYEGDAESFAWIIPVQTVPEVLVGNQALFDNLLSATVPTFTLQTRFEDCGDGGGVGLCAMEDAGSIQLAGDDEVGDDGGDAGEEGGGPEILDRGFAGAFEYVVLTGDTIDEIVDWLDTNSYAQDPDAPPILDEYLQDGFVFVAVKLRGGADVDEIHPLAIRYPGIEPCVPIKLTRIAAVDDMAIRTFFLGETRAAPTNWPHVVINPARIDWVGGAAASYLEVVSLAIDEAGGRAFVTEYAGTSAIVSTSGVDDPAWDSSAYAEIEPVDVVAQLTAQGLMSCTVAGENQCTFNHLQVRPLLETYLPVPVGVDPFEFWSCLSCYVDLIDPVAWSAAGFAADFEERIAAPGEHAVDMMSSSSYLTRLFTLLSPHEMLEDPLFHETESLPPVDNDWSATQVFACEGADWVELPDGRVVALDGNSNTPTIEGLPAAERIELVPLMGPPQVEQDNTTTIDELLDDHNRDRLEGPQGFNCALERVRAEALLTMIALFGIAWVHRGRRRETH